MNNEPPSYVIIGRGRWGRLIGELLSAQGRRNSFLPEPRRGLGESDENFRSRVSDGLIAAKAQIAWVCIPPCADVPFMIEIAVSAGLHVIAEKPWMYSQAIAEDLMDLARNCRVLIAVHFQYCLLERVQALRLRSETFAKSRFSGTFTLGRPDRLGIEALDNLGSHLLAIREYAFPDSLISEIRCGYSLKDERWVRIEADTGAVESIDLVTNEPIIQLFVDKFEHAIQGGRFYLDLRFATRVSDAVNAIKVKGNSAKQADGREHE